MALFTVTGAAGFIGSHLVDALLAAGHRVRGLDDFSTGKTENVDPRCEMIRGDVADPAAVREAMAGASGCFHLAAVASVARANEDWAGTHRTNLTGTVTVLDTAREMGGMPVVYASSAAVYGDLGRSVADEDAAPAPLTAYGADKLGSELHARVGALVHRLPTMGFRFFNVYGPRQDPLSPYSGVISIFARKVAIGQALTVHGDGSQVRDFVYVGDVVQHLMAGMRRLEATPPQAAVLNVCTGRPTTVIQLATLLSELAGRRADIHRGPARVGDIRYSLGNPKRAIEMLGVSARVALRDGLRNTLDTLRPQVTLRAA